MNIIIVGKNIKQVGLDLHAKTGFATLVEVEKFGDELIDYMQKNKTIAVCETDTISNIEPYDFYQLCEKTKSIPFFVANQEELPIEYTMCLQMNTWYQNSACYFVNDENTEYEVFLNIMETELRKVE